MNQNKEHGNEKRQGIKQIGGGHWIQLIVDVSLILKNFTKEDCKKEIINVQENTKTLVNKRAKL